MLPTEDLFVPVPVDDAIAAGDVTILDICEGRAASPCRCTSTPPRAVSSPFLRPGLIRDFGLQRVVSIHGWLVPACTMPPRATTSPSVASRSPHGFAHGMAELFLRDLRTAVDWLDDVRSPMPHEEQPSTFHR